MSIGNFQFGGLTIPRDCKRLFITAELVTTNGDPRLQPTGFPDVGPVFYPDPSGNDGQICLIESEASMANRLEEVCLADKYTGTLRDELNDLPYITVNQGPRFMTASTIDGHRFASEYVMKAKGQIPPRQDENQGNPANEMLVDYVKRKLEMGGTSDDVPAANVPRIFRLAMELDPLSLIHGFQISLKNLLTFVGLRSPRALTASIVGLNAQPVGVPGVRIDPIGTGDAGQAIFRKERIVAKSIEARFMIDVGLLWGLSLSELPTGKPETEDDQQKQQREEANQSRETLRVARADLLVALSLWKVAQFLKECDASNRLRTECDLCLKNDPKPKVKSRPQNSVTQADFPFAQIATESLAALITAATFPASRAPMTLQLA